MSNGEGYYNGRMDERNRLQPIIDRYRTALDKAVAIITEALQENADPTENLELIYRVQAWLKEVEE